MKKTISFFLAITLHFLCLLGTAFADDFSVRNGIQFGMSVDEVKQLEKDNGMPDYNLYLEDNYGIYTYFCLGYDTSLAGIDGSRLIYCFDNKTNRLKEIKYELGSRYKDSEKAMSIYKTVTETMIQKYGIPDYSSSYNGKVFPILTESMLEAAINATSYDDMVFNEWVITNDDYYILINCVYFDSSAGGSFCTVGYAYITKEEVKEADEGIDNRKKEEQRQRDKDL